MNSNALISAMAYSWPFPTGVLIANILNYLAGGGWWMHDPDHLRKLVGKQMPDLHLLPWLKVNSVLLASAKAYYQRRNWAFHCLLPAAMIFLLMVATDVGFGSIKNRETLRWVSGIFLCVVWVTCIALGRLSNRKFSRFLLRDLEEFRKRELAVKG